METKQGRAVSIVSIGLASLVNWLISFQTKVLIYLGAKYENVSEYFFPFTFWSDSDVHISRSLFAAQILVKLFVC